MSKEVDTKELILNAAEEAFAMKGFGGARTAEIAKKAGVNKALLHYYYKNKEGLYHAVMDRLLFDLVQIAQDVLKEGLKELLKEVSPILDHTGKEFELTFDDYSFGEPKYDEVTARYKDASLEAPLHIRVKL